MTEDLIFDKKIYYVKLLKIGIPVVLQNFIVIGLNLIDTLMIGKIGENQLAAIGAANQIYFIFSVSLFGFLSGAAVYTTQFYGAGKREGIQKMIGISFMCAALFSICIMLISFLFSDEIIRIFSKSEEVVYYGSKYIKIACFSYIFCGVSLAISYKSRAVQDLNVVTLMNFIALIINAVLNIILIYGKFGLPMLGVEGAALATLIARIVESAMLLIYIKTKRTSLLRGSFREYFSFDKYLLINVIKVSFPVMITEAIWSGSVALIFAAYGILGTRALATAQIANVVTEMLQCFYFGLGNGTAMIIGEYLGKGKLGIAHKCGEKAIRLTWILNIILGVFLFLLAKPITGFYNFNFETNQLIITTLTVMAIVMAPRMIAYMYIVGILRAGGDTMFCMVLEIACTAVIQVPLAYFSICSLGFNLPEAIAIGGIINLGQILIVRNRFKSGLWINEVVK
ncbi:MATE family efflux transporter [Eubacteriales bacterium KG127]